MIYRRNAILALSLLAFAFVAILAPTLRRGLTEDSSGERSLQTYSTRSIETYYAKPPQMNLVCEPGSYPYSVYWNNLNNRDVEQTIPLNSGKTMNIRLTSIGCESSPYEKAQFAGERYPDKLKTPMGFAHVTTWIPNNYPGYNNFVYSGRVWNWGTDDTNQNVPFPGSGICSTEFEFSEPAESAYIAVGGITSDDTLSSAARITMVDEAGLPLNLFLAKIGTNLRIVQNYAYQWEKEKQGNQHPRDSSLWAVSNSPGRKIKKVIVDHAGMTYWRSKADSRGSGYPQYAVGLNIYPGMDFSFCAPFPTPAPTDAPDVVVTPAPTDAPGVVTPAPTDAPLVPIPAGTSGDPIIMGLSGQIFKFNGRSGTWYSAASAKSFQWNMKIQKFEDCPDTSNTFITGVGLTVFADRSKKMKQHKIEVNVVNEHSTAVGCGNEADKNFDFGCLGAGSLELTIDGHKVVQSTDHLFPDKSGRVIAFNTVSMCSRRWFDFDVTPANEIIIGGGGAKVGRGRQLKEQTSADPNEILDILQGVKDTMVDKQGCEAWMQERRANGDLFKQTGTWSTVMIKTKKFSLHIEYKQEQERCGAHSLDVWISEVSPDVLKENWEGVIGETKNVNWERTEAKNVDRAVALKYPKDEAYEVLSPFTHKCKACAK